MQFTLRVSRCRRGLYGLVLAASTAFAPVAHALTQQVMTVETADHAKVMVELFRPEQKARALVIVTPGTGGLPDPYFDAELAKDHYDSQRKGGMVQALSAAGYAVAFVGQRGYGSLGECVTGANMAQRAESFVNRCVNQSVRATVDLDSNAEDLRAATARVSAELDLARLPLAVIAFSESFRHIAWLVSSHRMAPDIVIGVGGPVEPLSRFMQYQLRREWALNFVQEGLSRCAARELPVDRILACAGWPEVLGVKDRLVDALGGDKASVAKVLERREWWNHQVNEFFERVRSQAPNAPIGGAFHGIQYPAGWSMRFYQQMLQDHQSALQRLSSWQGPLVLIYGELDTLVRVPNEAESRQFTRQRAGRTEVLRLPGLGHGLETAQGEPPREALATLVGRIDDLLKQLPRVAEAGNR